MVEQLAGDRKHGIMGREKQGALHMAKKRVYVESSVISYLTARPAKKPIPRLRQLVTVDWWECRHQWNLFVSTAVMREIRDGDPEAAIKRLEKAGELPVLPESDEATRLTNYLVATDAVPKKSFDDALHVAIATICGMDYLLTWNMRHMYNPDRIERLYKTIREMGYKPVVLTRPDEFLEVYDGK